MTQFLYTSLAPLLASGGDVFDLLLEFAGLFKTLVIIGVAAAIAIAIFRANKLNNKVDKEASLATLTRRVYELEAQVRRLNGLARAAANRDETAQHESTQQTGTAADASADPLADSALAAGATPVDQPTDSSTFGAVAHLNAQRQKAIAAAKAANDANAAKAADAANTAKPAGQDVNQAADDSLEVLDPNDLVDPAKTAARKAAEQQADQHQAQHAAVSATSADTSATSAKPAKPASTSVEERLGTGVFIWIGGISLMLAGAFLVKYSFDNNLISERVRVILGVLFGLALLGAAQYMHKKSRKIASALAGAAIADLFACLLAASSLYELISSTTAFVLMIAVTGLSIILSLRHGRLVVIIGLIGGFVTPAIISQGNQQVGPLLAYLMLLQIAMSIVNRRRGWVGMTTFTMCGGLVWALILMFSGLSNSHRYMLEFFLIGSAALYILSASKMAAHPTEARENTSWLNIKIALSSVSAAAVLIGLLVIQGRFGVMDMAMLGLLGLALIILARLRPKYETMTWLAGAVSAITFIAWIIRLHGDRGMNTAADLNQFRFTLLAYGLLYAGGYYVAMWRSKKEFTWAICSSIAAVVALFLAKAGIQQYNILPWERVPLDWHHLAIVLSVVYALLAYPVWRARLLYLQGNTALGVLVTTSALFMALAGYWGLEYPWPLTAVAAIAVALAGLVKWQRIIGLREVAVLAGMVTTIFMIVPGTYKLDYSQQLIFNIILPAYAVPALLLGLAAWLLQAKRDQKLGKVLRLQSIILGAVGVLALIRHGYHPTDMFEGGVTLLEWATYSTAALVMGHALLLWHKWRAGWPQQTMATLLLGLGVFDVIVGAGLLANPLWHAIAVGNLPVLNALLFIYGVPALLIALLLWNRPQTNDTAINKIIPGSIGTLTLIIVFALISLQVRQYFHHPFLNTDGVSNPEMYSYSVAWILLGIVLVAIGIRFKSKSMRYASLAVMLIAIGKVFLLDTAHLEDLYRVISFLGLGVTLMVLGYVYQRFVFKRESKEV